MSLDIDQIALHQLVKRDEQTLDVVLRDSLLPTNAAVEEMMTELHRVYSAKSKALGLFNEGSELAEALRTCRKDDKDFLAFSRAATGRLRDELAKYPFAEGGVVLFGQYRYLAVEYLLIAVLNSRNSMRVNEELDINTTHYLDINNADIVARIDLTEWETNPESTRYLTFLRGRVGRKVADFFMDFGGVRRVGRQGAKPWAAAGGGRLLRRCAAGQERAPVGAPAGVQLLQRTAAGGRRD